MDEYLMDKKMMMDIMFGQYMGRSLADRVRDRYQAIQDLDVIDSRGDGMTDGRRVEFYPPGERDNPRPGSPTVEVFDPAFKGEALENIVAADYLHHMGKTDPHVALLRNQFGKSMTQEQQDIDRRAYKRAMEEGEKRPYDQWHDVHRLDQYIGAGYLPEEQRTDWMGGMTGGQKDLLEQIDQYMRTGKASGFDAEGKNYDYKSATAAGMGPDKNEHWGSVAPASKADTEKYGLPPNSYMMLKGAGHPTWEKAVKAEEARGSRVMKVGDRYFSVPGPYDPPEPTSKSPLFEALFNRR